MRVDTKAVLSALTTRLSAVGFTSRKQGILTKSLSEDVLGWIGLNRATEQGGVEINPVVGVRHQALEMLVAELSGDKYDEVLPPTIAMNVGYTSSEGRYIAYLFGAADEILRTADRCVEHIERDGMSFMTANSSLPALIQTLRTSTRSMPEQTAYRLPVALDLQGDYAGSKSAVEAKVSAVGSRTDPAALQYAAFAKNLLAKIP